MISDLERTAFPGRLLLASVCRSVQMGCGSGDSSLTFSRNVFNEMVSACLPASLLYEPAESHVVPVRCHRQTAVNAHARTRARTRTYTHTHTHTHTHTLSNCAVSSNKHHEIFKAIYVSMLSFCITVFLNVYAYTFYVVQCQDSGRERVNTQHGL